MVNKFLIIHVTFIFISQIAFAQNKLLDVDNYPSTMIVYYMPFSTHTIIPLSTMDIISEINPCYIIGSDPNFYVSLIQAIDHSEILTKIDSFNIPDIKVSINEEDDLNFTFTDIIKMPEREINFGDVNARLVIVFLDKGKEKLQIFGIGSHGIFSYNDRIYKGNQKIIAILYKHFNNNFETIKNDFYEIYSSEYSLE
ncbi:MAG: hypothetical protein LBI67_08015 [Treponema sp.]|jgi:hypothetical protein|nr:hypothetical protein [Treponema sp.]